MNDELFNKCCDEVAKKRGFSSYLTWFVMRADIGGVISEFMKEVCQLYAREFAKEKDQQIAYLQKDVRDRDNSIHNLKARMARTAGLEDRVKFLQGEKGETKFKQLKKGIEELKKLNEQLKLEIREKVKEALKLSGDRFNSGLSESEILEKLKL